MLAAGWPLGLPDADRGQARPHAGPRVRCVVGPQAEAAGDVAAPRRALRVHAGLGCVRPALGFDDVARNVPLERARAIED